jgi:hypothetical protein
VRSANTVARGDLGFGCPELGAFSLREITSIHLPFGLRIERDLGFQTSHCPSVWAEVARRSGSNRTAEAMLRTAPSFQPLPSQPDPDRPD